MAAIDARRSALAEFLRSRRERIRPDDVGLPSGGRRRTPGLRREEVAQLAGVGVTWYTWLEQGRSINASVQVLDAIARTLRLDAQERWHLLRLAGVAVVEESEGAAPIQLPGVAPILQQLEPFPVAVISRRFDIVAYNRAYNAMVGNLDAIDACERNQLWLFFTHPYWRAVCSNRPPAARHLVNTLRGAMTGHLDDELWTSLVARLREASAEFDELWRRNDVTAAAMPAKEFVTPVGELHVHASRLEFGDGLHRMIVYSPRDEPTRARLDRLIELDPATLSEPSEVRASA